MDRPQDNARFDASQDDEDQVQSDATLESRLYSTSIISGPVCGMLSVAWADAVAKAKIAPGDSNQNPLLVTAADFVRLWALVIDQANRPSLSRYLGERMASGPAIPVLFALSTAPDFATGLERMTRFKHLFGPVRLVSQSVGETIQTALVSDEPAVDLPPSFTSSQMVYVQAQLRSLATRPIWPLAARMPLARPEREDLADLFGLVPEHGEPMLRYKLEDLSVPFISGNEELWAAVEADLLKVEHVLANGRTMTEQVRTLLIEAFGVTQPTLKHASERLRISRTTLLRRLRDEGTSFQETLDKTREELAQRYLRKSDLTIQQIAHLLGYRDTSAFQRAFKKWSGQTPGQARVTLRHNR